MLKKIFNFLFRGIFIFPKNTEKHWSCFRGSITVFSEFLLVGGYVIFIDPVPTQLTVIKLVMVVLLIISFFCVKDSKLK